jgi:uncharacterized protein (DUF3084 family)
VAAGAPLAASALRDRELARVFGHRLDESARLERLGVDLQPPASPLARVSRSRSWVLRSIDERRIRPISSSSPAKAREWRISITSSAETMPCSGERSSWLTLARKALRATASSCVASTRARSSSMARTEWMRRMREEKKIGRTRS